MKKKINLLFLMIIAVCSFIPASVSAAGVQINAKVTYAGTVPIDLRWSSMGSNYDDWIKGQDLNPNNYHGNYQVQNMKLNFNGVLKDAYCVDPGLSASPGSSYTCSPITDPGMTYLINTINSEYPNANENRIMKTLAFRFYAVYAGIGNSNIQYNKLGLKSSPLKYATVHYARRQEAIYIGHTSYTGPDYKEITNVLTGTDEKYAFEAWKIAYEAGKKTNIKTKPYVGENDITYVLASESTATKKVYLISATKALDSTFNYKFTGKNAKLVFNIWDHSSNSGRVEVQITDPNDYNFKIEMTYNVNGLYSCVQNSNSNGGNTQILYTVVEDNDIVVKTISDSKTPTNPDIPGNPDEPDYPDDKNIPAIVGNVTNCCVETTHSYAKEVDLGEMFTRNETLNIDGYNPENYAKSDDYHTQINDFCDLYCTERVSIDIPKTITATSGRYFTLDKVTKPDGGTTTSPYILGNKRCRVVTKYNEWEPQYLNAVKAEVAAYNDYMRAVKKFEIHDKQKTVQSVTSTIKISASCNSTNREIVSHCDDYGNCSKNYEVCSSNNAGCLEEKAAVNITGPNQCADGYTLVTAKDSKDNYCARYYKWEADVPCETKNNWIIKSYSYNIYSFNNSISYPAAGLLAVPMGSSYSSIGVTSNGNASTSLDHVMDVDIQGAINSANYDKDHFTVECACKDNQVISKNRENLKDEGSIYTRSYAADNATLSDLAEQAYKTFQNAVGTVQSLRNQILDCNNFFNSENPNNVYNIDPSVSFKYNQVYRREDGTSVLETIEVPFESTPGCTISVVEAINSNITYTESDKNGTDAYIPQYSNNYGKELSMKDFELLDFGYDKNLLDHITTSNVNKYFTHDGVYKASCEWNEAKNNINTLVPNGAATQSTTGNFTIHEREYKLFLTTYEGEYETTWTVNKVGENGKFDKFINENSGVTCKGTTPSVDQTFTCKLKSEYEIVYTGKCNSVIATQADLDACEPVKDVNGVLQFKVVDPSNIFPTGTVSDGKEVAKNWTATSKGQTVKSQIEDVGKRDETYAANRTTYEFHLTPTTMRHIKNYNVTKNSNGQGGFTDFSLDCDCPRIPDGVYTTAGLSDYYCKRCRSTLIEDLSQNKITYNGNTYTNLKVWPDGKNLDQIRNSIWR